MPLNGSSNRFFTVTLRGNYGGTPTINVFDYRQSALLQSDAADIAAAFIGGPLAAIRATQNAVQHYTEVEVIDSNDVANFHTEGVTLDGLLGIANAQPGFIAWSLRLLRTSRDLRSGWKRFAGLGEADVDGNTFNPSYYTILETNAPDIIDSLTDVIATLPLVILRDRPTQATPSVDPSDPTTWYYSDVGGWSVPNRVTTQNSRKFFS